MYFYSEFVISGHRVQTDFVCQAFKWKAEYATGVSRMTDSRANITFQKYPSFTFSKLGDYPDQLMIKSYIIQPFNLELPCPTNDKIVNYPALQPRIRIIKRIADKENEQRKKKD